MLRALPVKVAANDMLQHPLEEKYTEQLEDISKHAADIFKDAPKVELALATVAVAGILFESPCPKDFQSHYAQAQHFAKGICKIMPENMPESIKTLMKAENAEPAAKKKTSVGRSSSTAAPSSVAASSDAGPEEPRQVEKKPLREKAKLA